MGSGTLPSTTTTTAVGSGTTSTTTTLPDPCNLPGLAGLTCRIGEATDAPLCGGALAGAKVERDLKSGLTAVERDRAEGGRGDQDAAEKRRTLLGKAGAKLRRLAKTAKRGIKNDAACAADVQGMLSAFQASVNQAKQ